MHAAESPGEVSPARVARHRPGRKMRRAFSFRDGDLEAAGARSRRRGAALLSEPFAYRHGLHRGDRFELAPANGREPFRVAGIVRDYGSDQGVGCSSPAPPTSTSATPGGRRVASPPTPGADPAALAAPRAEAAPPGPRCGIEPRASCRSLAIFDRTFLITGVLRLLTLAVAVLGILSASWPSSSSAAASSPSCASTA